MLKQRTISDLRPGEASTALLLGERRVMDVDPERKGLRARAGSRSVGIFAGLILAMLLSTVNKFVQTSRQEVKPKIKANYAIFLQLGTNIHLLEELSQCAQHVAEGLPDQEALDVHVAVLEQDKEQRGEVKKQLLERLPTSRVNMIDVIVTENRGADVGQFLSQLKKTQEDTSEPIDYYQAVLKIHAKSDEQWRRRMTESLCGSANQVTSILQQMHAQPEIEMVAALGTTFGPNTPTDQIYPRIIETYNMTSTKAAFDGNTLQKLGELYKDLGLSGMITSPKIVAGTSFWINWDALQVPKWSNAYERIEKGLTRGYTKNLGLEHVLERLIPSMIKGKIAEITPAPRVFALYFPQYHAFPENDRFWGVNFTEWTLLKPYEPKNGAPPVRKPLPVEEGGLGYYNLLDYETRKRQADLAREYGVTGFTFYHYWFSGSHAPDDHLIMTGLFDNLLRDGEPNLPFFFSWANEPWNRRWTGKEGEILLSQEYGDEDEWREHFMYLLKFFQHPNYEKVNGRPCFAIYRPGHVGKKFAPMLKLWHSLAKEHGFPGLHIIQTVGNFYEEDKTYTISKTADIQGSFQFWPQLWAAFPHDRKKETAAVKDQDLKLGEKAGHIQYWGAFTSFDRRPRANDAKPILRTPKQFDDGLSQSFSSMSAARGRAIDKNIFSVTAWNEWNEQALLEPDATYKFGFLEAVQKNVRNVGLHVIDDL